MMTSRLILFNSLLKVCPFTSLSIYRCLVLLHLWFDHQWVLHQVYFEINWVLEGTIDEKFVVVSNSNLRHLHRYKCSLIFFLICIIKIAFIKLSVFFISIVVNTTSDFSVSFPFLIVNTVPVPKPFLPNFLKSYNLRCHKQ